MSLTLSIALFNLTNELYISFCRTSTSVFVESTLLAISVNVSREAEPDCKRSFASCSVRMSESSESSMDGFLLLPELALETSFSSFASSLSCASIVGIYARRGRPSARAECCSLPCSAPRNLPATAGAKPSSCFSLDPVQDSTTNKNADFHHWRRAWKCKANQILSSGGRMEVGNRLCSRRRGKNTSHTEDGIGRHWDTGRQLHCILNSHLTDEIRKLATAHADGTTRILSLEHQDSEPLQWRETRLKEKQRFVGLALSERCVVIAKCSQLAQTNSCVVVRSFRVPPTAPLGEQRWTKRAIFKTHRRLSYRCGWPSFDSRLTAKPLRMLATKSSSRFGTWNGHLRLRRPL